VVSVDCMTAVHADAVILTALEEEHAAVVRALGDCDVQRWRGHTLHAGKVGALEVLAFPMGGMGNPGSAQAATLVISVWNPACIILAGIAGGIRHSGDDLRLGDVLVPDRIVGYEPTKIRPEGPELRYEVLQPDWKLLQTARGLDPGSWALGIAATRPDGHGGRVIPRAFFGPVLSGEKILADGSAIARLQRDWSEAIGVEMEGLGVAVASYRGGPGFLMAKAVSDFADAAKGDDWQAYAAETSARFAVAVLKNAPVQPEPHRPQAVPVRALRHFPGEVKIQFCRKLGSSWEELADFFEVSPHERARFRHGNEPRDLWQWLEVRDKLPVAAEGLMQIGRGDLAVLMRTAG
jgi:nucleoside phosphorylase